MGIVSATGSNVAETLCSLRENRSGIDRVRHLKTAHTEFPVGEIKMSNREMISRLQIPENKPATRTSLIGILAVKEALTMARLANVLLPGKSNVAFINGTTVGGMDKSELFYTDFLENDRHNRYIATHDCGACTEIIADYFGAFSHVSAVSTACSSAANAIMLGAELLKSRRADIVVAGGAECLTKFHLNGFNALMILDKEPCRPFDATRAGLNLGEGAAYLVMETDEHYALRLRNSHPLPPYHSPLAELKGAANACDAFHQTATSPNGEGAVRAMTQALQNAKLLTSDIDYINAHGTGTANNDLTEGIAIEHVFGNNIPPVSSTKAFTGHTTSAAGGVEAVIAILSLINNFIPKNLNFKKKIDEISFEPYSNSNKTTIVNHNLKNVLSNSFGFGGNDTSLIFGKT
jgi:3-oxoacyl-[acyl-carrier-protein] synthase-1